MKKCAVVLAVLGWIGLSQGATIPNADFELSVPGNGWGTYGAPVTVTWEGDATNHYARIMPGSGWPTGVGMASDWFAAEPMINNLGYDFSMDAASGWGPSCRVGYEWYIPGTSPLQGGWGTFFSYNGYSGWAHYTAHLDPLPDGAQVRILAIVDSWGTLDIDNVAFAATAPAPAAKPTFSPNGGLFVTGKEVRIDCATPNATIRYTDNGTDPTETIGTIIASGSTVLVDHALTLKARAWASGFAASDVASASFTIPTSYNLYRGVNMTMHYNVPSAEELLPGGTLDSQLDYLKSIGCDTVLFNLAWFQETQYTTSIYPRSDGTSGPKYPHSTPSDATLVAAIQHAQAKGLKVGIKCHLTCEDVGYASGFTPTQAWFDGPNGYRNYVRHYAQIAQDQHIDTLVIGNELGMATYQDANWRNVISDARAIYSGKLTYAALCWVDPTDEHPVTPDYTGWWSQLDYLGINAYYNVTPGVSSPTLVQLKAGWVRQAARIDAWWHALPPELQKPLVFTEFGVESANLQAQADRYEAMLSAMWGKYDWFKGLDYYASGVGYLGSPTTGYSVDGKPAADVVKHYYTTPTLPQEWDAVIPNADFELSVPGNGWSVYGGPVTVTWEGDAINHYAQIVPDNTNGIYPTNVGMVSDYFAVGPMIDNLGYDFSIDADLLWGADWQIGYEWYVPETSQSGWGNLIYRNLASSGWTHYTAHLVPLPANAQLRLIAIVDSWGRLEIDNMALTATTPAPAAKPTFNPNGGVVAAGREVTIDCATPNATIRYTVDGIDPTETYGTEIAPGGTATINQSLTLKARAFAPGYTPSEIAAADFTVPTSYDGPTEIPYGTAFVDGNLSDWAGANWAPLDHINKDNPYDIPEGYYSARWTPHKVYVAVMVRDTDHFFTNSYTDWNVRDAVEIFLHTSTSMGDVDYSQYEEAAQQYVVGITAGNHAAVWTDLGYKRPVPSSAEFVAAGREGTGADAQWLFYEVAMTPFDYFGGQSGQTTVPATLHGGDVLGIDVLAVGHDNATYTGVKAEHEGRVDKWNNYTLIGIHLLGPEPPTYTISGTVNLAGFMGDVTTVPVTVRVTQGSTVISETTTPLNSSSMFTVSGLLAGTYDVRVKAPTWLAATKEVTVSGNTDAGTFNLAGGDADGDNQVTFADFAVLQNHYGQSGMTGNQGDFNGDTLVTFEDFSILQNSYGQSGSPAGPAADETALASGLCGGLGMMLLSVLALAFFNLGVRSED